MSQNDNQILSKLVDGFNTLSVSIARIEEAVKSLASKEDMQDLKNDMARLEASTKSAHSRIDAHKTEIDSKPSAERVDNIDTRVKNIESNNAKIWWAFAALIIGAIMKGVLVGG